MNRAVIAIADQVIVQELRSRLDQSEADVEVGFVAETQFRDGLARTIEWYRTNSELAESRDH